MKKSIFLLGASAFIAAVIISLRAQTTAAPDSIVQMTAEADGLNLASAVPIAGTFWIVSAEGITAPFPFLPPADQGLPIFAITNNVFLVDATFGQVDMQWLGATTTAEALEIMASQVENVIMQTQTAASSQPMQAMTASTLTMDANESGFTPTFDFPAGSLWLQISSVSNGLAYLTLNGATDQVYEVISKTDLTLTNWTVEPGVLFGTNSGAVPFTLSVLDRTNALLVWAMDWTGVASGDNTVPDWWFWYYFQTLNLSDTDIDANGNTLVYDYTNGIAPYEVDRVPTLLSAISVADPVDIKWAGNLYVLSGSTTTLTEFDTNGSVIRSLGGLGSNPSGFDADAAGNVYVALTSGNQVWKFNPTAGSFAVDTNFGFGGFIGDTNGAAGSDTNEFNAPYDVAISPDGGTISISDSGNNRIQQFSTNGTFIAAFGSPGSDAGEFNMPKGLTYDSAGYLYVADSGNNRIVLAQGPAVLGVSGTSGTAFGRFNAPAGVSVNDRGVYVADTGNNRIQCFNPLVNGAYSFSTMDTRFVLSTNLNQPAAVAAVNNLTNELFYVADTGNNCVLLYGFPTDDPTPAWTNMTARVAAGDISGAISSFCNNTADNYQRAFTTIGTNDLASDLGQIGTLMPVFIRNNSAQYYFEKEIEGHTILFPVEFTKENGVWKILEF